MKAPLWPAALTAAVPPVLGAKATRRRMTRRVRAERGLCPDCGYDSAPPRPLPGVRHGTPRGPERQEVDGVSSMQGRDD